MSDDREALVKIGKILDAFMDGEIAQPTALTRISKVISKSGAWE